MFSGGSITIGRAHGVPIRAHWTLFIMLPYLAVVFAARFAGVAGMAGVDPESVVLPPLLWGTLVALALFASVAIHEVAHTLVAVRAGGSVREITLMILGGVSQVVKMPRRPRIEVLMAAAGPATSLALAGLFALALRLPLPADLRLGCFYLAQLNLVLGVFNLLPAFPMDGGRVLRGALAARLGPLRATRIASRVGQVCAAGLGLLGLVSGNFLLLFIALFIYTGAAVERRSEEQRESLSTIRVGEIMSLRPPVVRIDESLSGALEEMRRSGRLEAIVVDDRGEPMGIVQAGDLAGIPQEERGRLTVADLGPRLARRAVVVSSDQLAGDALERAAQLGAETLVVADGRGVLGWIGKSELENARVLRYLEERSGRAGPPRPRPA